MTDGLTVDNMNNIYSVPMGGMENLQDLSDVELRSLMWRYSWYVAAKVEACRRGMVNIAEIAPFVLNGNVVNRPKIKQLSEPVVSFTGRIEEQLEDISIDSVTEDKELISETLAEIYLQQGLKDKAIATYRQLILKYPKKSVYFADRISEIEMGY